MFQFADVSKGLRALPLHALASQVLTRQTASEERALPNALMLNVHFPVTCRFQHVKQD